MRYMGSKNRLAKQLVPIIQGYIDRNDITRYIEPFVGGANVIDKIKCSKKIGCDSHKELIHLLRYVQKDENWVNIPERILVDEYKKVREDSKKPVAERQYPLWYTGLVGFCSSFGAKYFGGYARNNSEETNGNWSFSAINNLKKQSSKKEFKDIRFKHIPFQKIPIDKLRDCVIYCDPPYRGTTKYKTEKFPYDEFYEWCIKLSKNNIVLISEYNMPEDKFKCIWEKKHSTSINSLKNVGDSKERNKRIEKLFIVVEGQ